MAKSTAVMAPATQPAAAPATKAAVKKRTATQKLPEGASKTTPDAKPTASTSSPKAKAPVQANTQAAQPAAGKDAKARKPKLVRDSFTFPKDEYAVIEALKERLASLGQPVKKSELLRAGLKALAAMSDAALKTALQAVPSLKTGRPKAESPEAPGPAAKAASKGRRK
ncbi:hypothetical protein [Acidovorax sp. BL-A-41-H1]|uniref:hypothetical protein n=1 Tax=Acidovorax sp. BL-A-41-H1 TaxID=3421102 RepID=UPI003F7B07C0